jgi:hypothetical protein
MDILHRKETTAEMEKMAQEETLFMLRVVVVDILP